MERMEQCVTHTGTWLLGTLGSAGCTVRQPKFPLLACRISGTVRCWAWATPSTGATGLGKWAPPCPLWTWGRGWRPWQWQLAGSTTAQCCSPAASSSAGGAFWGVGGPRPLTHAAWRINQRNGLCLARAWWKAWEQHICRHQDGVLACGRVSVILHTGLGDRYLPNCLLNTRRSIVVRFL